MHVLDQSQERYMLEELYNAYKEDVEDACAEAQLICNEICFVYSAFASYRLRWMSSGCKDLYVLAIMSHLQNIAQVYMWLDTQSHINPSDGKILANTNQKWQVKCLVDGVNGSCNCIMQKLCDNNNNVPKDVIHNILHKKKAVYDRGKRLLSDLGFE